MRFFFWVGSLTLLILAACAQMAATPPTSHSKEVATPVEPAAREAQRMIEQTGQGEVVPGFGGLFLDNGIVYVYMLDPSQQAVAEQATRIILDRERTAEVRGTV